MSLKLLCKWLLSALLYYSGMLLVFERWKRKEALILLYHRVADTVNDPFDLFIPPAVFERQITHLKERYTAVPLSEAVALLQTGTPLKETVVAITFDDGYGDNYVRAFPVLQRHAVPATFFLSVSLVGGQESFWYDRLKYIVFGSKAAIPERLSLPGIGTLYEAGAKPDRAKVLQDVVELCKGLDEDGIEKVIAYLAKESGVTAELYREEDRALRWEEVERMSGEHGIDIGSHGLHHVILTKARDASSEIRSSKDVLEKRSGKRIDAFAYPNGRVVDFDDRIIAEVRSAGYRYAVTNVYGTNCPGADIFRLRRRCVGPNTFSSPLGRFSMPVFACEMSGIFDLLLFRSVRQEMAR